MRIDIIKDVEKGIDEASKLNMLYGNKIFDKMVVLFKEMKVSGVRSSYEVLVRGKLEDGKIDIFEMWIEFTILDGNLKELNEKYCKENLYMRGNIMKESWRLVINDVFDDTCENFYTKVVRIKEMLNFAMLKKHIELEKEKKNLNEDIEKVFRLEQECQAFELMK